ncbi:MAG: four helix bundle protein [Flavisolibacter sp.]|jgi:four helix bundle protein
MAFKFENLKVWQKSLDLSDEINTLAKQFPKFELFNLCHQIRKAADSVVLNIAEGCTGQSNPEQARFLSFSIRSGVEIISCLYLARKKKYIIDGQFNYFYNQYEVLVKMITKFRNGLLL